MARSGKAGVAWLRGLSWGVVSPGMAGMARRGMTGQGMVGIGRHSNRKD